MNRVWLILDCSYLCHRAFHTMAGLKNKGESTGVAFGFLRDVAYLQDKLGTRNVAFCFDSPTKKSLRRDMFPGYKKKTKVFTPEQELAYKDFRRQLVLLRDDYLPSVGFKNIFFADGYEADDFIASCCQSLSEEDEAFIVSSDHDLFQLLSDNVVMWNPITKKAYTKDDLKRDYGVTPKQWIKVQAIAGCDTDAIPGVPGVAEKTASKYVLGELGKHLKSYQGIEDSFEGEGLFYRNLRLVRLPFEGTLKVEFREDQLNRVAWQRIAKQLGAKSLRDIQGFGL